jgi:hypothetical protein
MPLKKSASKSAFKNNLLELLKSGKPQNQALAISYDVKRKAEAKPEKK